MAESLSDQLHTASSGKELAAELEASPAGLRPQDTIESFETELGSVYTYGEDGSVSRQKVATDEDYGPRDLTVFVDLNEEQALDVHEAMRVQDKTVNIVERQDDDTFRIVRRLDEVSQPARLMLAVLENGRVVKRKNASLFPQLGWLPYDTRRFTAEDGKEYTQRHLGHKVTKITPRKV